MFVMIYCNAVVLVSKFTLYKRYAGPLISLLLTWQACAYTSVYPPPSADFSVPQIQGSLLIFRQWLVAVVHDIGDGRCGEQELLVCKLKFPMSSEIPW